MRLYRAFALLLAAMSTASCSMLGFHRKDADAPTQVALSLYAAPNVNPNPDALPPDTSASAMQTPAMAAVTVDTQAKEGPFLVNLAGTSKAELAEKMKVLLDYLQTPDEGKPAPQTSLQVTHATDAIGAASRAAPVATSTDTGAVASTVHTAAATTTTVAPYVPGVPAGVGKVASGVASVAAAPAPAVSTTSPKADTLAPKAEAPVAPSDATLTARVPVPLRVGNETPAGAGTHAKAPALGQYADGPSGLSATEDSAYSAMAGTPIAFKILQLKDDSVFLNADHDLLLKDLKKTLGSTYVDDDDYVLQPGQFKYIEFKKIDKNTRYIAVLANFHDQSSAVWKQVTRVESGGYKYSLLVMFQNMDVGMVDESYRQPPRKKS